jgi:hypothetical protein
MSHRSIWGVALLLLTGGSAWAAGTGTSPSTVLTQPPVSTNANPLPPPPPSSLNPTVSSNNTVPPTPAPATAGLPSTPNSPAMPSQQGLSATTTNESRPSTALSVTGIANVQSALAAGGLYRGPIDGNMTASVRAGIRQFQQISGLPQSGDLDAETLARLSSTSLSGTSGSNGNSSNAGNRSASEPFSTVFTGVPATPITSTPGGTATFSTPFQLSAPINTSPTTPPSVLVQP